MQPFSLAFFSFLEARRTYLAFLGNSNAHETALESSNNGGRSSGTAQTGNNENVGWTKAGKACVYNIDIMEETADNLAVGANAVSKRVYNLQNRIERFASQKDLKTYIGKIDEIIARKNKFFGQI